MLHQVAIPARSVAGEIPQRIGRAESRRCCSNQIPRLEVHFICEVNFLIEAFDENIYGLLFGSSRPFQRGAKGKGSISSGQCDKFVDGSEIRRSPPNMVNIHFTEFYTFQVVQEFFHQHPDMLFLTSAFCHLCMLMNLGHFITASQVKLGEL